MFNFISKIKKKFCSLSKIDRTLYDGIILNDNEINLIKSKIRRKCNMLVFGVGNDSKLWIELNKSGTTKFLEDSEEWFNKITGVDSYLVSYDTKLIQWKELLNQDLTMKLPKEVINMKWDVILVDAPCGYAEDMPGRMKSIFMAKKLIRNGGHVFVHDCDRIVEKVYFEKYLGIPDIMIDRLWYKKIKDK